MLSNWTVKNEENSGDILGKVCSSKRKTLQKSGAGVTPIFGGTGHAILRRKLVSSVMIYEVSFKIFRAISSS